MIKALNTRYDGYLFRSRLEARWAVFFKSLKIAYEYEAEGYKLSNGKCYLPDFWLPNFYAGMFAEVKPNIAQSDLSKPIQLAKDLGRPVILAIGLPSEFYSWTGGLSIQHKSFAASINITKKDLLKAIDSAKSARF